MASQLTHTTKTNIALISGITGQVVHVEHLTLVTNWNVSFSSVPHAPRMGLIWQNSFCPKDIRCMAS